MDYLVMKVKTSYAILLDEQGRFVVAANLNYQVGDTVQSPVIMNEYQDQEDIHQMKDQIKSGQVTSQAKKQGRYQRVLYSFVALAAAIVMMVFGVNMYQENAVAFSSVHFNINPDIEMQLNKKGQVINLIGENDDGRALLKDYKASSRDRDEVTKELMDRAVDMGYLEDGGIVNVTIDSPDPELFEQYGVELKRTIREHLDGRVSITITIMDVEQKKESKAQTESVAEKEKINIPVTQPKKEEDYSSSQKSSPSPKSKAKPNAPKSKRPKASSSQPKVKKQPSRPAPAPRPQVDDDDDIPSSASYQGPVYDDDDDDDNGNHVNDDSDDED